LGLAFLDRETVITKTGIIEQKAGLNCSSRVPLTFGSVERGCNLWPFSWNLKNGGRPPTGRPKLFMLQASNAATRNSLFAPLSPKKRAGINLAPTTS